MRLSELRGRPVVLYFYPKADTPGCTTQACGIRDHRADYEAAGVTVLGVSPDPVEAIGKFHDRQDLNFTLLADADHAVAEQYGVWVEKSMYGKTYMGVQRSTFIIDADGVVHVIPKASPKTHDDEVLKALREAGRGLVAAARSPRTICGVARCSSLGAPKARISAPSGPPSHAARSARARRARRPTCAELDDLVVELDARAAGHDDVDLLLVGVVVAEGHAEVRARA